MNVENIIDAIEKWVDMVVIGLNLCPFASRERKKKSIRFTVKDASSEEELLFDLHSELNILQNEPDIETTLIIHPNVLQEFESFNTFLSLADGLLNQLDMVGEFQIASFHPDYCFADANTDDVENYTNRSPYPILHLIREDSLERAIAGYPDIEGVPEKNCKLLREMGPRKMQSLLQACFVVK